MCASTIKTGPTKAYKLHAILKGGYEYLGPKLVTKKFIQRKWATLLDRGIHGW